MQEPLEVKKHREALSFKAKMAYFFISTAFTRAPKVSEHMDSFKRTAKSFTRSQTVIIIPIMLS